MDQGHTSGGTSSLLSPDGQPRQRDSWAPSVQAGAASVPLFRGGFRPPSSGQPDNDVPPPFPAVGSDFLGFHIVDELGRGAFGRVYLARQGDLANRPVALKISTEIWAESQLLARLQHTHIVPVYSLHRSGRLQAVCMPYFGSITLADVLDHLALDGELPHSGKGLVSTLRDRQGKTRRDSVLPAQHSPGYENAPTAAETAPPEVAATEATLQMLERLSYVDAVLWVIGRLAEGLAHAHERGVLHRDLKPANVLLTDEGQPMLLDFNLADYARQAKQGTPIGGTLPYMAPEHLAAFLGNTAAVVDHRSDLYALGVVLFELLTGKHPFTHLQGEPETVIPYLIQERLRPPSARRFNPAISPAVEAIVLRCLAPDPARRYQSAADLQEDLDRQRKHLPLRHAPEPSLQERLSKWQRRHPVLTSTMSVATTLLLVLAVLTFATVARFNSLAKDKETRDEENARLQASGAYQTFRTAFGQARWRLGSVAAGDPDYSRVRQEALDVLNRYQVLTNDAWQEQPPVRRLAESDREALRQEVGWLLLFLAETTAFPESNTTVAGAPEEAERWTRLAEKCFASGQEPQALWRLRSRLATALGRDQEAEQWRERVARTPTATAWDYALLARESRLGGSWRQAKDALEKAVAADANDYPSWQLLGDLYFDNIHLDQAAIDHFSVCIALQPKFYGGYLKRGLAYLRHNEVAEAEKDFSRVIELRPELACGWRFRATARLTMRQFAAAEADLTHALELPEPSSYLYFLRARVRRELGDRKGADEDFTAATRSEPTDEDGYIARGNARVATDPEAALADFARARKFNPTSIFSFQNSAHVLAERLHQNAEAIAQLDGLLKHHPGYAQALAGRAVLNARLGRRAAAQQDARDALVRDRAPATLYQLAGAYALTSKDHPEDRTEAYRLLYKAIQGGHGGNLLASDPDLAPLRNEAEFKELTEFVRSWQRLDPNLPPSGR